MKSDLQDINMKKILLLATGGTIASQKTTDGLAPPNIPDNLLSYVPEYEKYCSINTIQILNIDSTNIQPEDWISIAEAVQSVYDRYDGFVITHGTDTMAYTAAALSYLIQNPQKPIVITGSQRPINAAITDARKNLLDSIRFAADPHGKGVYIVFDGMAIVGTRARKVRSKSFHAFESINYPVAAFIDEHRITHYFDEKRDLMDTRFWNRLNPRIFLLKLVPGMEPDVLDYIGDHYDGVVIESYGVGGVPFNKKRNFLDKLAIMDQKGKIVVIASQVMLEGSDAEVYEVGFRAITHDHVLQAFDMTVEAAIVKLMWITAETKDIDEIKKRFYTKINNDILI
jgi:L-asparaginase